MYHSYHSGNRLYSRMTMESEQLFLINFCLCVLRSYNIKYIRSFYVAKAKLGGLNHNTHGGGLRNCSFVCNFTAHIYFGIVSWKKVTKHRPQEAWWRG